MRLCNFLIHDHDHVLRIAWDFFLLCFVSACHLMTLVLLLGWSNYVRRISILLCAVAHAPSKLWRHIFREGVALPHDPHPFFHAATCLCSMTRLAHRSNHGNHLVHHVVWQVTVQHPFTRINCVELNIASLCHSN